MIRGIFPIDKWEFKSNSVVIDLPEEEFERLFAHMVEDVYKKGQVIFREGGIPSGIYFIKDGKVKKYKVDKEGREQIIYVANAGELIGYHALLAEERFPDSASTLEDSTIQFIPKDDFMKVLDESKTLSRRLLKTLSHEFSVFSNSLAVFAKSNVRERLAMQLIVLREKYKTHLTDTKDVEINLSREDLANIVGTARENIVRILKDFKIEGIIQTNGRRIVIKDVQKLLAIVNQ
jgi:CRP-like cAMP-binding protein